MNCTSKAKIAMRMTAALLFGVFQISSGAQATAAHVSPITITSPSLTEGSNIPAEFTCAVGANFKSPQLNWTGVPAEAASIVLYLHDLDPHPNGGTDDVLHWVVWNIPPATKGLAAGVKNEVGAIEGAVQGVNTHATTGYYGPCPPPGQPDHHYVIEVFALNKKLQLSEKATRHELMDAMNGSIVGHGVLVTLFSRKQ